MIGFQTPQVVFFSFFPFGAFVILNNGQYKRVFVQDIKMRLDYSLTIVTIKYKMTFCGDKINEVWHPFEGTTIFFFFLQFRLSLYIADTQNIFGLLFHPLISSFSFMKNLYDLSLIASVIQSLLFTSAWPIILSFSYFSRTYM